MDQIEKDLHRIPKGLPKKERIEEEKLAAAVALKRHRRLKKDTGWCHYFKNSEYMKHRQEMRNRKKDMEERAPFRKYSNIWFKNCPMEPVYVV